MSEPKPPKPLLGRSCIVVERGVDGYYAMWFKQGEWDGKSPRWIGETRADVHRELQAFDLPMPVVFDEDLVPISENRAMPGGPRWGPRAVHYRRVLE